MSYIRVASVSTKWIPLLFVVAAVWFNGVYAGLLPLRNMSIPSKDLGRRGFILIEDSPYKVWPKLSSRHDRVYIPYCFYDAESEEQLGGTMDTARDRWHTALGSRKGVQFKELGMDDDDNPVYCTTDGQWTPTMRKGILVLRYKECDGGTYKPGQGWIPERDAQNRRARSDRHTLFFDPELYDDSEQTAEGGLTHELGHVLGLAHEHQRPDAWDNIQFNCENLEDYETAKEWIERHRKDWTIEEACSDWEIAYKTRDSHFKFSAYDFIPFSGSSDGKFIPHGPFDVDSIMMYGSAQMAVSDDEWPLTENDGDKIEAPENPTDGDVAAVNQLYPQR